MMDVADVQEAFVRKDLFGFGLTDTVHLFAFSGVAIIPLKSDYIVQVYYRFHLVIKVQG